MSEEWYFDFSQVKKTPSKQSDESYTPDYEQLFSKALTNLASQSSERITRAANKVDIETLRKIYEVMVSVLQEAQESKVSDMAVSIAEQGISAEELVAYLNMQADTKRK
ncbi:hypothetical protein [Vibrio agarivorans]|uniref:hypothetical protein n=1 Tax=Vibrio agarivorans TaxID=153622 RepID=UPI00222FE7D5|nr:hypothetical protein [Vibrio agarivorans]MDN3663361.1 hypothetical protein [Vibrio agarivorans]